MRGIMGRIVLGKQSAVAPGRKPLNVEAVLDGHRQPVDDGAPAAGTPPLGCRVSGSPRAVEIEADERLNLRLERGNAFEAALQECARRLAPGRKGLARLREA